MKLFFYLAILGFLQAAWAIAIIDIGDSEWDLFKVIHKKKYDSAAHELFRRKIYMENAIKINTHNKEYVLGKHTYTLGVNHFTDLLHHEFKHMMNGYKPVLRMNDTLEGPVTFLRLDSDIQLLSSVDWRTKGAVTPVKNQGQCGSCWSFSATGSLEGQHFRKTHQLVSLSEQNLVDCSTSVGNDGCDGGLMDLAFKWIKKNGGIDTEASYPYKAEDEKCRYNSSTVGATDKGYVDVTKANESALKEAVAIVGPISVAIDASSPDFQFYKDGVYVSDDCSTVLLDHGVLTVGYGHDKDSGMDYWLVKNSWGEEWGDQGYIKMARNHNNMCGISTQASYPLV